jgi:hypothetical protein
VARWRGSTAVDADTPDPSAAPRRSLGETDVGRATDASCSPPKDVVSPEGMPTPSWQEEETGVDNGPRSAFPGGCVRSKICQLFLVH